MEATWSHHAAGPWEVAIATHEHDPTDADASLVTSTVNRKHTTPNCQDIESSTGEPTRDIKGEQSRHLTSKHTVAFSSLGLSSILFVLTSISNYLNVQMSVIFISGYTFDYIPNICLLISIPPFPWPWTRPLRSFTQMTATVSINYLHLAMLRTPHIAAKMNFFTQMLFQNTTPY